MKRNLLPEDPTGFAMLAGYVLDKVQAELDRVRATITASAPLRVKRGTKPERGRTEAAGLLSTPSGIPSVALPQKLHPREKGHPGHAKWVAKMREVNLERWAKMPKKKREALQKGMQAGRKKHAGKASKQKRPGVGWENFPTPELRSAEALRRQAVRRGEAASRNKNSWQRGQIVKRQAAIKPNGVVVGA